MKSPSRAFAISLAAACLAAGLLASSALAVPKPAWAPIGHSGPTNLPPVQSEIQRLAVDASAGTYTLTFDGQDTAPIAFDASAATLEGALNALPTIGADGVNVEGGPGDSGATKPYYVSFDGGSLANTNVAQLSADSAGLAGGNNGTAAVTTQLDGGPGTSAITIYVQNIGGTPSAFAPTELEFKLPPGVSTSANPSGVGWSCPGGAGKEEVSCTHTPNGFFGPFPAQPGLTLTQLVVPILAGEGAESGHVEIEVWGGGARQGSEETAASFQMPLLVSAIDAPPGLQAWTAGAYDEEGVIDARAGAHPYSASTALLVNTVRTPLGLIAPAGEFRDIVADTPPGFIGNPIATEQCPEALGQANKDLPDEAECSQETIIATNVAPVGRFGNGISETPGEFQPNPVNNIEAPFGYPAKFRFYGDLFGQVVINVVASVRSEEDYGLAVGSYNTPQIKPVFGAFFTIWGQPVHAGHDGLRCKEISQFGIGSDCRSREQILEEGGKDVAFLTNPVDCAEEAARTPKATLNVNTWQDPSLLFAGEVALEPVTGCEDLDFKLDKFAFSPGQKSSDSPASFTTELQVPSGGLLSSDPDARMNPTIRETVLDLPEGVVLNASAADGLQACSEQQIGLLGTGLPRPNEIRFSKAPDTCPDAAKIGSGELKSALLADPLSADLFLAAQGEGNPFGSLFAIYLVIENPRNGIFIKLPGEVQVNEQTGKQKVVFKDLPPLPFSTLKLNLKGGPRSPLATPTTCGTYTTDATNTPWSAPESGPPLVSGNSFTIDQGPNGQACAPTLADRPFDLGLNAGSANVTAGAHSPFSLQITRPDGAQEVSSLEIKTPPGFTASLKGVPYCSDAQIAAAAASTGKAEQASPACPAASRVGSTNTGSGSGSSPFYAPGALYLSGPYKGAPLSVVAITPAVAGPFDLGNVVVRSALHVDPVTAQITAKTDPIPEVLKGVVLRIRDIRINLDRNDWALNPTSCEPKSVAVTARGNSGAVANLSNRFQVGGCENLGFRPKLRGFLRGGTKRSDNPAFTSVLTYPEGAYANIASAAVTLPHSAFLDQSHIRTICTRVQFAANACPQGAIYGQAEAITPLLDQPLRGNVYLRSSSNKLPDLVVALRGPAHQPIAIDLAGRIDSVNGGIRTTFDVVPDAPVSKFILRMQGGKKGLLVNSRNLCRGKAQRMKVRLVGHNGKRSNQSPPLKKNCGKKAKKKSKKHAK